MLTIWESAQINKILASDRSKEHERTAKGKDLTAQESLTVMFVFAWSHFASAVPMFHRSHETRTDDHLPPFAALFQTPCSTL